MILIYFLYIISIVVKYRESRWIPTNRKSLRTKCSKIELISAIQNDLLFVIAHTIDKNDKHLSKVAIPFHHRSKAKKWVKEKLCCHADKRKIKKNIKKAVKNKSLPTWKCSICPPCCNHLTDDKNWFRGFNCSVCNPVLYTKYAVLPIKESALQQFDLQMLQMLFNILK